jgi:hypothetical protein
MARDSDNLARSFETEDTGGLLTGFLAEEDQFDRRSLWRLGSWGVGAVGAVVVTVLANQSSVGWRRERIASVDLTRQSQQIQSIARESQNETRRLASAIDTLNGDRDRLYSRITVLEQGLDSVTGSIARQSAAAGSAQATPQPSPMASSSSASASPLSPSPVSSSMASSTAAASAVPASAAKAEPPATQAVAPAVAPVATAAAAKATDVAVPDTPPPATTAAKPASAAVAPIKRMASNVPAATPVTPLMPAKSTMGPPDAAAGKLIAPDAPPEPAAAAPAPEGGPAVTSSDDAMAYDAKTNETKTYVTKADAAPAASTVQRTEFAVDLGTANSVAGLRALWRGLLKSRSNAALTTLRPLIAVKESNNGAQLRLVAGPLGDAAAAAKICAVLVEHKRTACETTVFDGQQLELKDDEPQASAKPAAVRPAVHRRGMAKQRVTVEEPPKPQPTTLSSFFSR